MFSSHLFFYHLTIITFRPLIFDFSVPLCPQRSLEDEINRTTAEDIPIFMISYAVIFVYIAVALGEYSSWKRILVRQSNDSYGLDQKPYPHHHPHMYCAHMCPSLLMQPHRRASRVIGQ